MGMVKNYIPCSLPLKNARKLEKMWAIGLMIQPLQFSEFRNPSILKSDHLDQVMFAGSMNSNWISISIECSDHDKVQKYVVEDN